ncbi:MAG TPA: hypothetical protein VGQ58_08075 [Candidatus Limnocylindrales bacterium]|nr:hypothetical protein [Candidatus Limnocylindrales bacterium]
MEFYNKLNANERLVATGAIIVLIGALVSVVTGGLGFVTLPLLGAIAVLAIYYLKYSPTQTITWPAPIPLIVLVIAAISAIFGVLGALQLVGILFGVGLFTLAVIAVAVGSVIMAWGAWQEYQAMPKTTPPSA